MSTVRQVGRFKRRGAGGAVPYSGRAPHPSLHLPLPLSAAHRRRGAAFAIVLAAAGAPLSAQPLTWNGRVGLASDWVVRGLRLSDGNAPVAFAGADVYASTGWSLGVAALRLRDPAGRWSEGWSLHAGHGLALDERWLLLLDLQHNGYEGSPALAGWRGTQLALGLADGDRWSLTWNAEQPRDPALVARTVDFNLRWPLRRQLSVEGGLGRVLRTPAERYSYGQVGLAWQASGWRIRLDRTWAQSPAYRSYGSMAARRWVGSAQWTF